jgi:hypothetical protein
MLKVPWTALRNSAGPALGLLLFRLLLLAALPYEAVIAYGDLRHFHQLAELATTGGGLPFLSHWIEFPPLFPFLSIGLNSFTGGSEHAYVYALAAIMACFDAANLLLLFRILTHLPDGTNALPRAWAYFAFLCRPALGWWTFEPLGVFWLLLTVLLVFESGWAAGGLVAGLGLLTKWIPGLGLLVAWTRWPTRRTALAGLTAVTVLLLAWVPLIAVGRQAAWDSLRSQAAKPAWETPWALLEGSLGTGTFGEASGRLTPLGTLDPGATGRVVPRWLPPALAAVLGALMAVRVRGSTPRGGMSFLLVSMILLFLASPGWSPQWLAYLVPLVLLSLPEPRSALFVVALTAVAILEWPVLLSRGRFDLLWLTVTIRTAVLILLAVEAWRVARLESPTPGARSPA